MTQLAIEATSQEQQHEYLNLVKTSGEALLVLINDILDLSKIEAGRLELELIPFAVRPLIDSTMKTMAWRAAEKRLGFEARVHEDVPENVVGDPSRLRQVLINLLGNAVKFTDEGRVSLDVHVETCGDGEVCLRFAIADTGIGIPADKQQIIFDAFTQADGSTSRKYGGSGLGLAISRRLAELMGGRMWAESAGPGQGATFRFTIVAPLAPSPEPKPRDYLGTQPELSGKRVLIVDDNATNRRVLSLQTGKWGMAPRDTGSPHEALRWIAEGGGRAPFDLAILDMHMPEMDGVALAASIKARQPALPLVLFSSLGRREAGVSEGLFTAYLAKPMRQSNLFDALVGILAHDTAPREQRHDGKPQIDTGLGERHPLRILLAEDNVVNQKLALRILKQMGYRADLASNGLEAVESVERQAYDVVLMDVQMPEMDGLDASRRITARWAPSERPRIVAMTANAMQGDREMCLGAGMDDYLTKPIQVDRLAEALRRATARNGR
jgi:CheY-like chemotaxis protein